MILNLTIYAKFPLPYKITFIGSRNLTWLSCGMGVGEHFLAYHSTFAHTQFYRQFQGVHNSFKSIYWPAESRFELHAQWEELYTFSVFWSIYSLLYVKLHSSHVNMNLEMMMFSSCDLISSIYSKLCVSFSDSFRNYLSSSKIYC